MAAMPKLSLWAYAAIGGSLSVTVGGLASLLVPRQWGIPAWVAFDVALCTGTGLLADRFVREDECGDVYHRYDDDPLTCTLNRSHVDDHATQGAQWGVGHQHGDRKAADDA
jgi:hypothetical protein